jgi:rhodanese-related sulfurtransferase
VPVTTTLRELNFDDALALVDDGAAFVDLRPVDEYLDVHIPGSLELLYEFGPGMASRARDCLPLDLPVVLMECGEADLINAAASLRGKGFTVVGSVADAINQWARRRGAPASTESVRGPQQPAGLLLVVGDPGARPVEGATHIPIEKLWGRAAAFGAEPRVVIISGAGVRAALAVGMLEHAGVKEIVFWRPN